MHELRTYARTHARTHARPHTHTHTHKHVRTHARMHARTHTLVMYAGVLGWIQKLALGIHFRGSLHGLPGYIFNKRRISRKQKKVIS